MYGLSYPGDPPAPADHSKKANDEEAEASSNTALASSGGTTPGPASALGADGPMEVKANAAPPPGAQSPPAASPSQVAATSPVPHPVTLHSPNSINIGNPAPSLTHPIAYYSFSGTSHALPPLPSHSSLHTRQRSPALDMTMRGSTSSPSSSDEGSTSWYRPRAAGEPATPRLPPSHPAHSVSATTSAPLLRPGAPLSPGHTSNTPGPLPLMPLNSYSVSSVVAAAGTLHPSTSPVQVSASASPTTGPAPKLPDGLSVTSGSETPTSGQPLGAPNHTQNGVYHPNIWMGEGDYRQQQQSGNHPYFSFSSVSNRRDARTPGFPNNRWRERENSGGVANGFIGGGHSATSSLSYINGLNGFAHVNGLNGTTHHQGSPTSPIPATPSPRPAAANSTPGGVEKETKEFSPFSYDYDRHRDNRRDTPELPFRSSTSTTVSSSSQVQLSKLNQAGSYTLPPPNASSSNHFTGQHVNPGIEGYVPYHLGPVPPRLTPALPQGHYGDVNSYYGYNHQNHGTYQSWSGVPSADTFFVPEMNGGDGSVPGISGTPLGAVGNLGTIYRSPEEIPNHTRSPTPPPLSGSAAAGASGDSTGAFSGGKHRRTGFAPSVQKPKPQRRFPCPDCNEAFTRRNDLARHRRKHTGEKPFSCPVCGQAFARKDKLLMHIQRAERCTGRTTSPRAPRARGQRDVPHMAAPN